MTTTNPSGAIHPTLLIAFWIGLTIALQYAWPLPLSTPAGLVLAGRLMIVLGGALMVWGQYVLRKHGTTYEHKRHSTVLVTDGPFRFSRNPIYVGLVLIPGGVAAMYGNGWGVVLLIPLVLLLNRLTIRPEEAYLERQFGEDYTRYRNAVGRWF